MRRLDLSGETFGWLTVLPHWERRGKGIYWLARCRCGDEKFYFIGNLRRGLSQSCGCRRDILAREKITTHGLSKHPLAKIWRGMRQRCRNSKNPSFPHYGGRGIRICERWDDFGAFYEDMLPTWERGLTLDRIDVNGHYSPENCRWADRAEQSRNRTTTVWIDTPDGRMLLSDAARKYGIRHPTLHRRWSLGLRGERLIAPVSRKIIVNMSTMTQFRTSDLVDELNRRGFKVG